MCTTTYMSNGLMRLRSCIPPSETFRDCQIRTLQSARSPARSMAGSSTIPGRDSPDCEGRRSVYAYKRRPPTCSAVEDHSHLSLPIVHPQFFTATMQYKSIITLVALATSCYAQLSGQELADGIDGLTKRITELRAALKKPFRAHDSPITSDVSLWPSGFPQSL